MKSSLRGNIARVGWIVASFISVIFRLTCYPVGLNICHLVSRRTLMIDIPSSRVNRAVSSMFRLFGGADARTAGAEGTVSASGRAMHAGEQRFFAIVFPLSVLVATWHALDSMLGGWGAWVLALPCAFLLLHVLPFILAGHSPGAQWRLWLAAAIVWAWFHRDATPVVAAFAWTWLGIAVMNFLAVLMLGLRASMSWKGGGGIAWRIFLFVTAHAAALALGWIFGWHWTLFAGAFIASLYCLAVLRPNSQWLGSVLRFSGGPPLLTFDDGPHPESTPALLDLLDTRGVKALFFLIGENARRHPELVCDIARRGHEIGNHTLTHPQATFWCAGPWRTAREISRCQKILTEITGIAPRYFRAPVGHRNFFTHPVAAILGLQVVGWTRRGYDADPRLPAETVVARIVPHLRSDDIVLLHEGRPDAPEIARCVLDHMSQRAAFTS